MRGVVVAELVLLAAAFAVSLLLAAALLLQCCLGRGTTTYKRRPPPASSSELPLSRGDLTNTDKQSRLLLLLMLCSGRRRRRARVEPAAPANTAEASPAVAEVDDVARWRELWFGPASRALYTIDEVDEEYCPTEDEEKPEPETPFYTPPASPLQFCVQSPPTA